MKNLKNPARIRAEPEISKTLSTRQGFVLTSNPHRPNIPPILSHFTHKEETTFRLSTTGVFLNTDPASGKPENKCRNFFKYPNPAKGNTEIRAPCNVSIAVKRFSAILPCKDNMFFEDSNLRELSYVCS